MKEQPTIAVIGLGYVGLPLAVAFAEKYQVIGFDINTHRIAELNSGQDSTLEVSPEALQEVLNNKGNGLTVTDDPSLMKEASVYIVTVPTPTNKHNQPVLTPLEKASETVGKVLKEGDVVIYESTVYPGVTEDICVPILEQTSKLAFNTHFFQRFNGERLT